MIRALTDGRLWHALSQLFGRTYLAAFAQPQCRAVSPVALVVKEDVSGDAASQPKRRASHDKFRVKLDQIIQSHGISNGHFDDSRESIYAGRGE